jgi:hypothetical protein
VLEYAGLVDDGADEWSGTREIHPAENDLESRIFSNRVYEIGNHQVEQLGVVVLDRLFEKIECTIMIVQAQIRHCHRARRNVLGSAQLLQLAEILLGL